MKFNLLLAALISINIYGFDAQHFKPKFINESSLSNYSFFYKKEKPELVVDLHWNFAKNPLEFGETDNNDRLDSIVDNLHTLNFSVGYQYSREVQLILGASGSWVQSFEQVESDESDQQVVGFNDFTLGAVWNFKENFDDTLYAMSLYPYIKIPTGDEKIYIGDSNIVIGADLTFDFNFEKDEVKNHLFSSTVGIVLREEEELFNLNVGSALNYGFGYQWLFQEERKWWLAFETIGELSLVDPDSGVANPLELLASFKDIQNGWAWNAGYGIGLTNGYGAPDYRLFAGATFWTTKKTKKVVEKRKVTKEQILSELPSLKGVQFKTNSDVILTKSYPILNEAIRVIAIYKEYMSGLKISGHTDSIGNDIYNYNLSTRRAASVKKYLEKSGVLTGIAVSSEGFGETKPLVKEIDRKTRAQNRRVELEIELK